jgi:hypothetical protein
MAWNAMKSRWTTLLYAAAVAVTPVSVASKFLLGATSSTWIDPSLLLSLAALLTLLPHWEDFLERELQLPLIATALLFAASLVSAISGLVLRTPESLYTVLREPLRLWLNLAWFLTTCWFLRHRPRVVLVGSILAVTFALSAGIYLELAAFRLVPAPELAASYARAYLVRQTLWFHGFPLLRMGGLFFEAPPFGLFMFSQFVVLALLREGARLRKWSATSLFFAGFGLLFSLSDQVLIAAAVGLFSGFARLRKRWRLLPWFALLAVVIVCGFELQTLAVKQVSSTNGIVSWINGGSVGERDFHVRYSISLLGEHPSAAFFGIGPGRYGEYAADTGNFPGTVTVQTSEMEILVEWGALGLLLWLLLFGSFAARGFQAYGVLGLGFVVGLLIADSFQANWKHEAVFLALAVLVVPRPGMREAVA